MRDIFFRGKRILDSEWVYGYLDWSSEKGYEIDGYPVDEKTIGQDTGAADINGKAIFEGDIIKVNDKYIHEIIYDESKCSFRLRRCYDKEVYPMIRDLVRCCAKVIGNVHDNPELLKESAE